MGFKKLSKEEIKYAIFDNIIGMPLMDSGKSAQKSEFLGVSSTEKTKTTKTFLEAGQRIGTLESTERGKKIIIIDENLFTLEFDSNQNVVKEQAEEKIIIKNPASADSVWNIKAKFGERALNVSELQPNEEWVDVSERSVTGIKPGIFVFERFSRSEKPDSPNGKNDYFLDKTGNNEVNWAIFVRNVSKVKINALELYKDLPKSTKSIENLEYGIGKVTTSVEKIRWVVENLEPGKMIKLSFKAILRPVKSGTGIIRVIYNFSQTQDLSSEEILEIKSTTGQKEKMVSFFGSVKTAGLIDLTEQDESPNHWDAKVRITNRSELSARILVAELVGKEGDNSVIYKKDDFSGSGGLPLPAFEEVTLLKAEIESSNRPMLKYKAEIFPDFSFEVNNTVSMSIDEKGFELNDVGVSKQLSVSELQSFTEKQFQIVLNMLNNSSLPISELFFQETLPVDFKYGEIDQLTIQINDHPYTIEDLKKQKKVSVGETNTELINSELRKIDSKIKEIEASIKEISDKVNKVNRDQLQKKLEENNAQISELSKLLEDLKKNKIKIEKESQTTTNEYKKLDTALTQLNTEIQSLTASKSALEELTGLKKKKASLESEITSLKVQIDDLKPQIDAEQDPKKKAKLEKQQNQSSVQMDTKKTELKNLDEKIAEIEKKYKNQSIESISEKMTKTQQGKTKIEEQFKSKQQEFDKVKQEIDSIEKQIIEQSTTISKINEENKQIKDTIGMAESNAQKISESESKLKGLQQQYDMFNSKKLIGELLEQTNLSASERVQKIVEESEKILSAGQTCNIFIDFIDSGATPTMLIRIMGASQVLEEIKPNSTVKITYPVVALKPKPNSDYKFPSVVFYSLAGTSLFHRYQLAESAVPTVQIIHQRRGISLGRIVDNYIENDKIAVTVLVKNTGNISIKELRIADFIPENSEILNMSQDLEEISTMTKQKKIIWKIDSLGPYQELEISYILKFLGDTRDMDEFDLILV